MRHGIGTNPKNKPTASKTETITLLAAHLAGLALGYWRSQDEIANNWALDREFVPQMPADERDRLYRQWPKTVEWPRDWEER